MWLLLLLSFPACQDRLVHLHYYTSGLGQSRFTSLSINCIGTHLRDSKRPAVALACASRPCPAPQDSTTPNPPPSLGLLSWFEPYFWGARLNKLGKLAAKYLQRRLVVLPAPALLPQDLDVGGHDVSQPHDDDVPGHQVSCIDRAYLAIP
jgi:hypothetical protein